MFFNTLEVRASDAQRLSKVLATRKLLDTPKDYAFLCKDLELFENNAAARKAMEAKASFVVPLGTFLSPAFELGEDALGMEYLKKQTPKKEEELSFGVGAGLNWKVASLSGISFFVTQAGTNKVLFLEGPYPNKERHLFPYTQKRLIFKLANYFYNRRPLYEKIYKSLLENKIELTALTNQEFAEDLTLLFSVKSAPSAIPDFLIAAENLKTRALKDFWKKEARTMLGSISCYLKKEENGYKTFFRLKIEVNLNKNNGLSFVTAEALNYVTPKAEEIYSSMEEVLLANTNAFLQQIVASTNFAAEIYEKVKTKILLENI